MNSDRENVISGYDLFELSDVKVDGEEQILRVLGSICEGI